MIATASVFSLHENLVTCRRVRGWGWGTEVVFVRLKLLHYQTSSQNSSVCGWVHWVSLDFSFPLSILLSSLDGILFVLSVLTHGSWAPVRHLLAFAPTNPPTDEQAPQQSCSSVTQFCVRVPGPPAFSTVVWMDTALMGLPCPGSVGIGLTQDPSSCMEAWAFLDRGPARELLGG